MEIANASRHSRYYFNFDSVTDISLNCAFIACTCQGDVFSSCEGLYTLTKLYNWKADHEYK